MEKYCFTVTCVILPGSPVVKTSSFNAEGAGLILGIKIPHAAAAAAAKLLQLCPTVCDPMDCRKPAPRVYQLPEFTKTHVH